MQTTEELGIKLAEDVLKAEAEMQDEALVGEINKIIEASSSALQEAFMSAIRAQRSEAKARKFLEAKLKKARAAKAARTG